MPPINPFLQRAAEDRNARVEAGLWRQRFCVGASDGRYIEIDGQRYLQFASNDYLGLAQEADALQFGGAGASPLVTGYHQIHARLEQTLCELTGYQAALLFSSGFAANSAPMALLEKDDLVLADKLSHASILDAALSSPARLKRFAHNDMAALESSLIKSTEPTLVVSESVFSMDGDCAPMKELVALGERYSALTWLDDAHGFGVIGDNGLGAAEIAHPDLLTLTFGKALGAQGAALLGPKALIDAILQKARHYIYSTGLSLDQAERVLAQLGRMQSGERRTLLADNIAYFRDKAAGLGLPISDSKTAIQPVIIGDNHKTLEVSTQLKARGLWIPAIRPPTVPKGQARLRVVLTSMHSKEDIDSLLTELGALL